MSHCCYACSPGPNRVVFDGGLVRVPGRFAGPIGLSNGGIATGMLACIAARAAAGGDVTRVRARLRAGVPLERDLRTVTSVGEGGQVDVTLLDGENPLVTGTVTLAGDGDGSSLDDALATDIATLRDVPDVSGAPPFYEITGDHPIPGCFSCGPAHESGLHIIPRSASDGVTRAEWSPGGAFADPDGALCRMIATSALDCSSGICMPLADQRALLDRDQFFLLGSLDVRYLRPPLAGETYRVSARARARDGRKFYGVSALFGADGVAYATAEALWIVAPVTRTEAFGA